MTNTYINGTFSKLYFTASNNFDLKLSKSLCSNIEQWFIDCDDMQALPKNEKGELSNKTLKATNYELLSLPKYANEKGKMLKVDNEKKDEIRFLLANYLEYKGQKKIRDLFDNSTVFLNNYMKKYFDYTAPKKEEPKVEEPKVEEPKVETDTVEVVKTQAEIEKEILDLAYSNLYSLMTMSLNNLANEDVTGLHEAEQSYGDSWKKRGGVGAFMMLARKWDRLENQVTKVNYDIFQAIQQDTRPEGILDDIQDLRRYLLLVEAEVRFNGIARPEDKSSL